MTDPYWNHNVHHHPAVLAAVPDGCRTALDAGCGDGLLARKLAERSASVTGVDRSAEMIERARGHARVPGNVTYLEADHLADGALPESAFDFVSAVAVVHTRAAGGGGHPPRPAHRIRRSSGDRRHGRQPDAPGLAHQRVRRAREPVARPPERRQAQPRRHAHGRRAPVLGGDPAVLHRLLPGCTVRRTLLWRCVMVWDRPREGGP
ncbi:class I SAM-dependent methyltransferase [Streptomyces massasporeus]|uniref:class I SAM-dependent methyltransferase n=1 Tax=Streptomyces massasporeus TaxID=67324 RepID=UPI0036DFC5C8